MHLKGWVETLRKQPLPGALTALALGLSAWYLAGLVAVLWAPANDYRVNIEPLRPQPQIARFTWFAQEQEVAGGNADDLEAVGESLANASINAELLGVVMQGEMAWATIRTPGAPRGVYTDGDEIVPGVTLFRIEPTRVIIARDGEYRQIAMRPLTGQRAAVGDRLVERVDGAEPGSGFSLAGVIGATPVQVEGHGIGLRLDSIDPEIEQISDLRARDVILRVGGQPVEVMLTNPAEWQQIMTESSVGVEIEREGETRQITVNARSLGERILPNIGQGLLQ